MDLSFFPMSLKDASIKLDHSFLDLHSQQDVGQVLEIVLEELTGPSIVTNAAYNIKNLYYLSHLSLT